jgi:hypothetical protein
MPPIDTRQSLGHRRGMVSLKPSSAAGARVPVFRLACWFLGLMAFLQLLVAGMALATRFEESRIIQVIEKPVANPVVVRIPAPPARGADAAVSSRPPVPPAPEPAASPLKVPRVADPRSERLIDQAREARVAGDMGLAIVKLQEALTQSPEDPSLHFELGLVHEQMGVYDIAASHYETVYQMGTTGAGALYESAAAKLRDGFDQPDAMHGKLSLGRVRIFKDPNQGDGQRVILTIPVQKSPADEVELQEIEVSVIFFNRTSKGEIVQLEDNSWVREEWVTQPFDWATGEECLRMSYTIPPQDSQTEHLFGERTYYGQVVSLSYRGEVLDVQAWPRDLAVRIPRPPPTASGDLLPPEFQDSLPPNFDPEAGMLPPLPANE